MIDKDKLIELVNQGKSDTAIAGELNRNRSVISKAINKLGLRKNKRRPPIDINLLRESASSGMSFSEFGRQHGYTVSAISAAAKRHSIVSQDIRGNKKAIDDVKLCELYKSGVSIRKLGKLYGIARFEAVRQHILSVDPTIIFRTVDEAIRPALLNNRDEFICATRVKSFRKIAKELGVKTGTVCAAAKRFGIISPYYIRYNIPTELLAELYMQKCLKPKEIASELNVPYYVIIRALRNVGLPIAKSGGVRTGSKYPILNDRDYLYNEYVVKGRSIGSLSSEHNIGVSVIQYHLIQHGIPLRSKAEYIQQLMDNKHGSKLVVKGFVCDSLGEVDFLNSISSSNIIRNSRLEAFGSHCYIDFVVDGQHIEVKSEREFNAAPWDRRRFIKQYKICEHNGVKLDIKINGKSKNVSVTDDDIYYAYNWKLFFNSADCCSSWLADYGFKPIKFSTDELYNGLSKAVKWSGDDALDANKPNACVLNLMRHYFEHYWRSSHDGYLPLSAIWEDGNRTVLRDAVRDLWENKNEINIYGLYKCVNDKFKDFKLVSMFKPWVAKYIYDKYLGSSGRIIDPCCGWGGRLLGTLSGNYSYFGYDLNQFSIDAHNNLYSFMKKRLVGSATFQKVDSSTASFINGDLLFTSPPYDNTELYYGINSNVTKSMPIIDNIFKQRCCPTVVLNVPKWLEKGTVSSAELNGYKLFDRVEMRSKSIAKREFTTEPILVFMKD